MDNQNGRHVSIEERIAAEEARWAEVSAELQRQYQLQFGAYQGRIALLKQIQDEEAVAAANGHLVEEMPEAG